MGEPAINGVLTRFSQVRFGDTISGAVAQVDAPPPGSDKPIITFSTRYQYEDFKLLASTMAHEALHQDSIQSNKEELIAIAIDTLVYGQFVLETPSLATSGTELARLNNSEFMGRINTRDANGKLRLLTSTGNIFPESNVFVPYFAAPFEPLGDSTPGSPVLKAMVKKIVPPTKVPRRVHFNDKTALLLDKYQRVFTAAEAVQLAEILKLDTSPPSTTARRVQESTTTDQPTPSWREVFGAG